MDVITKSMAMDWAESLGNLMHALVAEGFTKEEAFELIVTTLGGKK